MVYRKQFINVATEGYSISLTSYILFQSQSCFAVVGACLFCNLFLLEVYRPKHKLIELAQHPHNEQETGMMQINKTGEQKVAYRCSHKKMFSIPFR